MRNYWCDVATYDVSSKLSKKLTYFKDFKELQNITFSISNEVELSLMLNVYFGFKIHKLSGLINISILINDQNFISWVLPA